MENNVIQRIKEVFDKKETNPTKFSKGDSALQNRLSRQLRGASITFDTIQRILEDFEDISAEWLLRGKGDMYVQDKECDELKKYDAEVEIVDGIITIRRK